MVKKEAGERPVSTEGALAGILALLADARERAVIDDRSANKTEVILASAGMSIDEIAAVTGKKYDAVRMTIHREKAK